MMFKDSPWTKARTVKPLAETFSGSLHDSNGVFRSCGAHTSGPIALPQDSGIIVAGEKIKIKMGKKERVNTRR
jgi:hypothetical protein